MKDDNFENSMARLRWACRRGMLELDVLLNNFLENAYSTLSSEDKSLFEELLHCTDPELFAWLMGHEEPPATFKKIIEMIRSHARSNV